MTDTALRDRVRRFGVALAAALVAVGAVFAVAGVDDGPVSPGGSLFVAAVVTVAFSGGTLVWALSSVPAVEADGPRERAAAVETTTPGETYERLRTWRVLPPALGDDQSAVRDRLRTAAVAAVAADAQCGRIAARERVERGDWTDDPVAAAFLGDCQPPRRVAAASRISPTLAFAVSARAAVAAVDDRADGARRVVA